MRGPEGAQFGSAGAQLQPQSVAQPAIDGGVLHIRFGIVSSTPSMMTISVKVIQVGPPADGPEDNLYRSMSVMGRIRPGGSWQARVERQATSDP
jgi:hypothetical protein